MAKRPSLTKQIVDTLNSLARFGQSKFETKQQAIAANKVTGIMGWNPARVDGIYSIETMKTYRKECITFGQFVKEKFGCRWLSEAKNYVDDYLKMRINRGDSAWTLQMTRAALRKLYQDSSLANSIKLPVRHKTEITRSRGSKAMDKKFSAERNRDLVDFCRATGLRRHEMQVLKVENVYRNDDQLWVHVEKGKGGRLRNVPVLQALEDRVLEIIDGKQPDAAVFERVPVRADIHSYRREYANALYKEWAGRPYDPRDKDRSAMFWVSWALGHNRLDVVSRNYLD